MYDDVQSCCCSNCKRSIRSFLLPSSLNNKITVDNIETFVFGMVRVEMLKCSRVGAKSTRLEKDPPQNRRKLEFYLFIVICNLFIGQ